MSDELLIKCEAPTLAGLKTGNLFSYNYESREEVTRDLRRLNRILVPKGLRLLPLQYSGKRVLLYLYRILALQKDLSQDEASRILREVGYNFEKPRNFRMRSAFSSATLRQMCVDLSTTMRQTTNIWDFGKSTATSKRPEKLSPVTRSARGHTAVCGAAGFL